MSKSKYIQPTSQLIKLDAPVMQDFTSGGWNVDGEHQGEVDNGEGGGGSGSLPGWGEND